VLIVDDDESTLDAFGRMLRLEGYEVLTAVSGDAALREVETFRPEVILLDLRMPAMDGIAFLRRLRALEDQRHTPIAVITGDLDFEESVSRELRELGAELHFKPLWFDDLLRITQGLLQRTA
jgi:two-component system OmpR family response regulator